MVFSQNYNSILVEDNTQLLEVPSDITRVIHRARKEIKGIAKRVPYIQKWSVVLIKLGGDNIIN